MISSIFMIASQQGFSGEIISIFMAIRDIINQGFSPTLIGNVIILLPVIGLRDIIWRSIALWNAGKSKRLTWFVCLVIFNTAGILPILYLLFFKKKILSEAN